MSKMFKDLGVTMVPAFTYSAHIDNVVNKARDKSARFSSSTALCFVCSSLVRSLLEYSAFLKLIL